MLASLLLLTAISQAHGAPLGAPLVDEGYLRLAAGPWAAFGAQAMVDPACTGAACQAVHQIWSTGGRAELALPGGLALLGDLGYQADGMEEAFYEGSGWTGAVGARGALSIGGPWRLALTGRVRWGVAAEADGLEAAWRQLQVAPAVVLSPEDGTGTIYLGASFSPSHALALDGTRPELDVTLEPALPVGLLLGGRVLSDELGAPWSPRDRRLALEVEGIIGWERSLSVGLSLWL